MGPYKDRSDPARIVNLVIVGEREDNVDAVTAIIGT